MPRDIPAGSAKRFDDCLANGPRKTARYGVCAQRITTMTTVKKKKNINLARYHLRLYPTQRLIPYVKVRVLRVNSRGHKVNIK